MTVQGLHRWAADNGACVLKAQVYWRDEVNFEVIKMNDDTSFEIRLISSNYQLDLQTFEITKASAIIDEGFSKEFRD